MLQVFLEVVLPVALIAAVGGLVGRWQLLPVRPVSTLVFYLFSPALVFYSLATTELPVAVSLKVVAITLAVFAAMYVAATGWSFAVRHGPSMRAGFALAATIPNAGNMGLPVAQLGFGDAGFDIAVMNFVAGAVLAYSLGIAVASTAGGAVRDAWQAPLRYPALYAAGAGVLVNATDLALPVAIEAPTRTLADAAVPTMLVVLGLQLQQAIGREALLDTAVVNGGRLLIAPVVAYGAAVALGLDGDARGAMVVLAAMPTAVIATILATEFGAAPAFVTRAVVSSTLVSMLSLTVLIALLR